MALVAAAGLAACEDNSVAGPADLRGDDVFASAIAADTDARAPELGVCERLSPAPGSSLVLRTYANGVQIYRWNGSAWTFVAPSAVLTADAAGNGVMGTHYAGPSWESMSGSKVVGAVRDRCTPDASAIPWLLLDATPVTDHGIFRRVSSILRIHTAGGLAPTTPGSFVGEEARVPYTTEYLFYRSE